MSMIGVALSVVQQGQRRYFGVYSESSLEMRFGCNAPRTTKPARCLRWSGADTVRGRCADRAVFSAHRVAGLARTARPVRPAEQPLQCQRVFGGFALPPDPGAGA